MNPHILMMRRRMAPGVLLLGAGLLLASCDEGVEFLEPCYVQDSWDWQAKYELLEAPASSACPAEGLPPGERVGVFSTVPVDDVDERRLTFNRRPQVSQPEQPGHPVAASARLGASVGPGRLCTTESFSAGGNGLPEDIEGSIRFQPRDVRLYRPSDGNGSQLGGELTYTADGCTWRYAMRVLYPAVACDPALDASDHANAARTCGPGSGVNPAFAVECDARLAACVLSGPVPSLR